MVKSMLDRKPKIFSVASVKPRYHVKSSAYVELFRAIDISVVMNARNVGGTFEKGEQSDIFAQPVPRASS